MINSLILFCIALGLFSCQQLPTVVKSDSAMLAQVDGVDEKEFLKQEDLIFVDIRNPLDVEMKTLSSSVSFWWQDQTFIDNKKIRQWIYAQDIAANLAAKGVSPASPIVLVTDDRNKDSLAKARCVFGSLGFVNLISVPLLKMKELPRSKGEATSKHERVDVWSVPEEALNLCSPQ